MEADRFRDRNGRYGFLVAHENARRILAGPEALEAGRRHLKRFSAGDPPRRDGHALWSALLDQGAEAVAARLTERGARSDYVRDTAPSFSGLPGPVRARLLRDARSPLDPVPASGSSCPMPPRDEEGCLPPESRNRSPHQGGDLVGSDINRTDTPVRFGYTSSELAALLSSDSLRAQLRCLSRTFHYLKLILPTLFS